MVKVQEDVKGNPLPCEIYLDGYMKRNLENLHEYVKRDWDGIGFIVGEEGSGKSVCGQIHGLYLDADLNLDKICFNAEQFEESVDNADPQSCIIWDESDALGENWQSKIIRTLKAKFKRIRDKNLYIFLITPTVFDLNKYFVLHRTRFLIHVYSKGFKRGFLRFFNKSRKKELYLNGKREWDMSAAKANFTASFTDLPDDFPIKWGAYEEKKKEATANMLEEDGKSAKEKLKEQRQNILSGIKQAFNKRNINFSKTELADILNVSRQTVYNDLNDMGEM